MKILLAESAGFCFGVNRAINLINDLLNKNEKVCTIGPIIHNPQVIQDLSSRGVEISDTVVDADKNKTIIVRTHGIEKDDLDYLLNNGYNFCDATCPFVKKIHNIVNCNSNEDGLVLIAGNENHPEVRGIVSYCKGDTFVFNNYEHLYNYLNSKEKIYNKIIVVSQTTFNSIEWKKCVKIIKKYYTNALIFDTICNATNERQTEAIRLASECDAMIIVGGRQSSNTAKLKAVCENCCPTFLIETADELKLIDLSGYNKIGLTAGASTPAAIIKEVLSTMTEDTKTIETEIEKAGEVALTSEAEDMNFEELLNENLNNMSTDQKVKGIVTSISPSEIQVDIGRKQTGYIPVDEYSADPTADPASELKIGDELNLIIMKTNDLEGTIMLSKKRYDAQGAWDKIESLKENNETAEGTVTDIVKGGIIVVVNSVRIFVPASLSTASRNDSLEDLLKTKVKLKIIEVKVDRGRRKAVGSIKAVIREERKAREEAFWDSAEEGQTYNGIVKSLTNYGAFVDIGGIDGMVHISEMSWKRIKHPSEVFSIGQEVEVYIKSLDKENKKISLGYKKAEDNPWAILERDFPVDTVIDSEIVGLTTFGAFATVIPGIEGLIHISQIANKHIAKPADVLSVGDKVKCKITAIDFEKNRVSLSMRALLEDVEDIDESNDLTSESALPSQDAVEDSTSTDEDVADNLESESAEPVE